MTSSLTTTTSSTTTAGAGSTSGQPVASTCTPLGVSGHLSMLFFTPSPSSSPSPCTQQYAPAITPTAPPRLAATAAVWNAPAAAPAKAPPAAHKGQSVFCRPAQPVKTLVTRIRGNAVRIILINFSPKGSAQCAASQVKTSHSHFASLSPYLLGKNRISRLHHGPV